MNSKINNILANIRTLFNIDEEATVSEIDQHLIDQVESQGTEAVEVAPEEPPAEAAAEPTPEEPETEEEQAPDELHTLREMIEQQQETIQQQQQLIEQLQKEIAQLKQQEAAIPTGGKKEQEYPAPKSWMNHPLNQKLRRRQ